MHYVPVHKNLCAHHYAMLGGMQWYDGRTKLIPKETHLLHMYLVMTVYGLHRKINVSACLLFSKI